LIFVAWPLLAFVPSRQQTTQAGPLADNSTRSAALRMNLHHGCGACNSLRGNPAAGRMGGTDDERMGRARKVWPRRRSCAPRRSVRAAIFAIAEFAKARAGGDIAAVQWSPGICDPVASCWHRPLFR
jgi:hypothetical protein